MKPKKILSGLIITAGMFFAGCQNGEVHSKKVETKIEEHEEEEEREEIPETWKKKNYEVLKQKQLRQIIAMSGLPQEAPADSIITLDDGLARLASEVGIDGEWIEKGSNNMAGRISRVYFHQPNSSLYALSSGGNIWKGNLDGTNWVSLNDQMKFLKGKNLHVIRTNEGVDRIVLTDFDNVFYSDNDGQSWAIANIPDLGTYGGINHAVMVRENVIYQLAKLYSPGLNPTSSLNIALLKSTDHGENFEMVWHLPGDDRDGDKSDFFFDFEESDDNLYIVNGDKFYSHNTLTDELTLVSSIDVSGESVLGGGFRRVYLAKDGNDVYVSYEPNNSEIAGGKMNYIYRSTDNGVSWNYVNKNKDFPMGKDTFLALKGRAGELVIGEVDMMKTSNGASTWDTLYRYTHYYADPVHRLHADVQDIERVNIDGEDVYIIACDGGIWVSYNAMDDITNISLEGLNVSQYYGTYTNPTKPNIIYAGTQDQGAARTFSGYGIASYEYIGGGDNGYAMSGDNGKNVWNAGLRDIRLYRNADDSTVLQPTYHTTSDLNYGWFPGMREHPYESNSLLLGGGTVDSRVHLYKLTYVNGIVRSTVTNGSGVAFDFADGDANSKITGVAYSPINKDHWFVSKDNGKFFFSTDAGAQWTKSESEDVARTFSFYMAGIVADPNNIDLVYAGGNGYDDEAPVKISRDGGMTFEPFSNGLPATYVYSLDISDDGQYLFAATAVGAYVLPTSGDEWFDLGGPEQNYRWVEWVESIKTARFATYGRGIWDFNMSGFPAGSEYFHIVHKGTNLRFQTCSTTEGSWVETRDESSTWHCTQWKIVPNGEHFYLQNRNSGMYIRPVTDSNGSALEQRPTDWNGNWTQWSYVDTDDGFGHLVNKATGKHVFVTNEGSVQQQPNSWDGDWTRYKFVPVVE